MYRGLVNKIGGVFVGVGLATLAGCLEGNNEVYGSLELERVNPLCNAYESGLYADGEMVHEKLFFTGTTYLGNDVSGEFERAELINLEDNSRKLLDLDPSFRMPIAGEVGDYLTPRQEFGEGGVALRQEKTVYCPPGYLSN